jgi:hypothetical protein
MSPANDSWVNKEIQMNTREIVWVVIAVILFLLWLVLVAPSTVPTFLMILAH